jgi:hypothetical protein
MAKTCILIATFVLALQGKPNSDLKYDEKAGLSVQKFPKNDEWDFKDMGRFALMPKIVIAHKVDELWIEIIQRPPAATGGGFDLKKQAETDYAGLSGLQGFTEVKQIALAAGKLPLNGANGANTWHFEASLKIQDKPYEWREWVFVGKENQCEYVVMMHGEAGMYKKHQKIADFVLGNIKTWKIPK